MFSIHGKSLRKTAVLVVHFDMICFSCVAVLNDTIDNAYFSHNRLFLRSLMFCSELLWFGLNRKYMYLKLNSRAPKKSYSFRISKFKLTIFESFSFFMQGLRKNKYNLYLCAVIYIKASDSCIINYDESFVYLKRSLAIWIERYTCHLIWYVRWYWNNG